MLCSLLASCTELQLNVNLIHSERRSTKVSEKIFLYSTPKQKGDRLFGKNYAAILN